MGLRGMYTHGRYNLVLVSLDGQAAVEPRPASEAGMVQSLDPYPPRCHDSWGPGDRWLKLNRQGVVQIDPASAAYRCVPMATVRATPKQYKMPVA